MPGDNTQHKEGGMSDQRTEQERIHEMVKGRECCRRLVSSYETARAQQRGHAESGMQVSSLQKMDATADRMLGHLAGLAVNATDEMSDSSRRHAERLLVEMGDLLERAMILERELRLSVRERKSSPVFSARAVNAYKSA
jgi:hypothetical protein